MDNLFILHSLFNILKNKKKKLHCALVDFAKAFDTVWRDGLWHKLLLNNMNGNMFNVIVNMYKDTKSRIVYKNSMSEFFPCSNGVRQGENLSPFLFVLFLNDLETFLETCDVEGLKTVSSELKDKLNLYLKLFIILYADDTVIMAESDADLQKQLDSFSDYCDIWRLKVNVEKSKIVVFSQGRTPNNLKFNFNGKQLQIVDEFNYLGVLLTKNGNFNKSKMFSVHKGAKAMYEVLKLGRIQSFDKLSTRPI